MDEIQVSYYQTFHQMVWQFHEDKCFTDIVIDVGGRQFTCHKLVLSSLSSYFRNMFTVETFSESLKSVVSLPFLQADIFEIILEFLYTGKVSINPDIAAELFEASDFLQIGILHESCKDYLKKSMLNVKHCLKLWKVAKRMSVNSLEPEIFEFILEHVPKLMRTPDFLDLELEDIRRILENDSTCLPGEDEISELIFKWLEKDIEKRKVHAKDAFKLLRLPFTSGEYLFHQLYQEHSELIANFELFPLIEEAKKYYTLPARQPDFWTEATKQRPSSVFEDVIIVIGNTGDQSKVQTTSCYGYSSKRSWFQLQSLPGYRKSGIASCAYGQSTIFVSGGKCSDFNTSRKLIKFDGRSNIWSEVDEIPLDECSTLMNHNMTIVSKGIYVLCGIVVTSSGLSKGVSDKVYCYNFSTNDFQKAGELVEAVHTTTTAVCNGKIIVFGGFGCYPVVQGQGHIDLIQCFDPRNDTCSIITNIPAILGSKAVGFDDVIQIITPQGKVLQVSFEEKTYKEIAEIPKFSRARFEVVKRNESLILIGGTGKDGNSKSRYKDMMFFESETVKSSVEPMPLGAIGAVKLIVNKKVITKLALS